MVTTVEQEDLIWGRNVVTNALKSGRALNRVLIGTERGGGMAAIRALAQERRILVENASRQRLDDLTGGAIHQGVVAFTARGYIPTWLTFWLGRRRGESHPWWWFWLM